MRLVIIFKSTLPQNFSDYLVLKVNPTYNVEAVHLTKLIGLALLIITDVCLFGVEEAFVALT